MSFEKRMGTGLLPRRFSIVLVCLLLSNNAAGDDAKSRSQLAIEEVFGFMLQEHFDWRTPNTYYQGDGAPTHYLMRFKWGPFKQHVIGEMVGIHSDEGGERESRI